jgi:hypothetical protein
MVATEEYLCPVVPLMAEELFERTEAPIPR